MEKQQKNSIDNENNDDDHNDEHQHRHNFTKSIQYNLSTDSPKINMKSSLLTNLASTSNNYHQNVTSNPIPIEINENNKINETSEQEQPFSFNLLQQQQQQKPSSSSSYAEAANNYLNQSWRNALQISSLNMPSLPDYFTSVPMPSMPIITMPNLPSIPTITMPSIPSMPNLSMPNISIPSMPNINLPSISDFMPFYLGKNLKSWKNICLSVREARKKYASICPSLPFDFNFGYDVKGEKIRIYFLASINSFETTLHYCDVEINKSNQISDFNLQDESNQNDFSIDINVKNENQRQQNLDLKSNLTLNDLKTKNKPLNIVNSKQNTDINDCDDLDIDNNSSSGSPTSITLSTQSISSSSSSSSSISSSSSPNLNESYMDTTLFQNKSIKSLIDSIEWKPLIINLDELMNIESYPNNRINYEKRSSDESSSKSTINTSSQEEDLILQRKRIILNGIFSYDFHPKLARFVFTMKNAIYWFDDNSIKHNDLDLLNTVNLTNPPYTPKKIINNDYVKLNATICPYQPDLVAYTADNDLWVCDLISGSEIRLTDTNYTKTAIMAGRPSFVMQEEFSRYNGFWWRPSNQNFQNVYTILCEFVDESNVEKISLSGFGNMDEMHRFPKPGSTNAKSTLKLVHFSLINPLKQTSDSRQLKFLKIEDLDVKFEKIFPQYEYLIRCDWLNGDVIWVQLLNRQQNHLSIIIHSITNKFPSQIIYDELHTDHWYNCHEVLYFFEKKSYSNNLNDIDDNENNDLFNVLKVGSKLEFLWSSEISGYRHLYKIIIEIVDFFAREIQTIDGQTIKNVQVEKNDFNKLKAKLIENRQLTNGNWEVSESMYWVDEQNDLIFFIGTKDSPLEKHLYVISSSTQSSRILPKRLSKEDFTHTRIVFDRNFKYCIDFQSNVSIPSFAYLHKVIIPTDNSLNITFEPQYLFLNLPDDVKIEDSMEYYEKVQILGPTPQLFECKLRSGELIHGFLFKPSYLEPGFKYPVLLEIYGGPEVQLVTKSFKELRYHRRHLIASEGYIVVGFDSRGSKHRGVDFEKHIYKRLGQVEIDDQVEALQWLAENTGFIDMNRVAIHGWSYGGYLSLMALIKRPDIFKCAIAGAPVTNWLLYDTGYTERYMGLPTDNAENYRKSNILSHVKNFPNEHNRLLIVHGLMDENVHFCHTAQLIQALVMSGKPYQLSIYPYERHSLKKVNSAEHFEATLLHFLQQNL